MASYQKYCRAARKKQKKFTQRNCKRHILCQKKAKVSGKCFPLTLLLGKRFITDGNKKIKGRKEYIVVDIWGLPMAIKVHEANIHDSKGAKPIIENL